MARLRPVSALAPLFLLLALFARGTSLGAQEKTLRWPSIAVEAHLDQDGQLYVKETQAMAFSGDWNGGERRFSVALQQHFEFERMVRVDSASGADVTMVGGDLDRVDGFDLTGSNTVRWRSRLESDPPFV
ncbi:MAG: hypothetical protein ABI910_13320, partial [Gemmatimonadota bacterium]